MYLLLLLVGGIGFVAMTALGFLHGGGGKSFKSLHHGGHGGHTGHAGHGHSFKGPVHHHHGQSAKSFKTGKGGMTWLAISPLDLFSYAIGAGATGIILAKLVAEPTLAFLAVIGAFFFNFGVIKPLMGFALRFATRPSDGLEGMIAHRAEAVTNFDPQGRGLVKLQLDDQTTQVLATLDRSEHERGVIVCRGDEVVVLEVDSARSTCRVTRELSV